MTERAQVAATHGIPIFHDGTATWAVKDTKTGKELFVHRFLQPAHGHPQEAAYIEAQCAIARALANAMNAAGDAAIDQVLEAKAVVQRTFFPGNPA